MGRPNRTVTPDVEGIDLGGWFVFEVMMKTIMGQFCLVPTACRTELILGVLGHFLERHTGVRLHHFSFQSNHFHLLCSVQVPSDLSNFMRGVARNITTEMHAVNNEERAEGEPVSSGPMWEGRYHRMAVAGGAVEDRMAYTSKQGVFEGVVADPRHWPGATALPALLKGETLKGLWIWRWRFKLATRRWEARGKTGPAPDVKDYSERVEVLIHPAPGSEDLNVHQRQTKMLKMVQQIVREGAAHRAKHKIGVMAKGAAAKVSWRHRPKTMKRSPMPYCFGTSAERRAYYTAVMALMVARREACAELLAGLSYEESGFAALEGKVMLPNELQALCCAKARAAGEQSAGD